MLDSFKADPNHPLVVVPDCNILMHGKSFTEMPWSTLGASDIVVLVVGRVLRDLEHRKRQAGRPGKLARDMSSTLRPLIADQSGEIVIRNKAPRVALRLWIGPRFLSHAVRDNLDLADPDQTIINQALARRDDGEQVLFLTDDGLAAGIAQGFSLPTLLATQEWRREPEKDGIERENASLKAKISRLEAAEPSFVGWFENASGEKISRIEAEVEVYQPLDGSLVDDFSKQIMSAVKQPDFSDPAKLARHFAPEPQSILQGAWRGPIVTYLDADEVKKYHEDYDKWCDGLRDKFARMHEWLDREREWPAASFVACNEGMRPASDILVELSVSDGLLVGGPDCMTSPEKFRKKSSLRQASLLFLPPQPPRPRVQRTIWDRLQRNPYEYDRKLNPVAIGAAPRDPEKFYYKSGKTCPMEVLALESRSWRHQRSAEFFPFLVPTGLDEPAQGLLTASVSASNLSRPFQASLPISITPREASTKAVAETWVADVTRILERSPFGPWPTFKE